MFPGPAAAPSRLRAPGSSLGRRLRTLMNDICYVLEKVVKILDSPLEFVVKKLETPMEIVDLQSICKYAN